MAKKDSVRVVSWGIVVEIKANIHNIYLKGQILEEARKIIIRDNRIPDNVVDESLSILKLAQECNAILQEIRNNPVRGTLQFSFEIEFWDEFLKFKNNL